MEHKLKRWRKANGVSAAALAARVNRLARQVYRWENGVCVPEPSVITQLAEITGGEVPPTVWFEPSTNGEG